MTLRYIGTAGGFVKHALPRMRLAALAGLPLDSEMLRRWLRDAEMADLEEQILNWATPWKRRCNHEPRR